MHYKIDGENLPVLKISMEPGEVVQCEAGAMSWMDDEIEMQTNTGGGLGKVFGRALTGERLFMNTYVAHRAGEIAFSSKFPGSIRAIRLTNGEGIIIQKGSFLACAGNIQNEVFIQKRIGSGFFGGEGFLMRHYHGDGIVFLEIDGSAHEYDIPAGDVKIIDTGYLASMSDTMSIDIKTVSGLGNIFLGGEGLFNTRVFGPGHVILQSMPIGSTAMKLYEYMPHSSSN
ncbi:MAG: TIGR00266 family protein [Lachnospiraceae bacterium]|jgi:uncharacterized protein (TIGR00266 family)|nr:TIGR00266 family protein [Lachnospiraceae bacterium]MEE3461330.1 TIGR00266 family protein [Lachnospiraceae bacterium]